MVVKCYIGGGWWPGAQDNHGHARKFDTLTLWSPIARALPPRAPGETLDPSSDRAAAALQCRSLLGGVALVVRSPRRV
jgi:hypothetical protein